MKTIIICILTLFICQCTTKPNPEADACRNLNPRFMKVYRIKTDGFYKGLDFISTRYSDLLYSVYLSGPDRWFKCSELEEVF